MEDFHSFDFAKRTCHLNPWFKEASIILVTGERGIGKSFFAHLVANSIRKGESCGAWDCQLSAPILIIDGEMSCNDLQERCELLGLNTDGLSPLYLYSDALANQHGIQRAHLMNEAWREKVKSIILARHVKILILDNLASLASGIDENSKKDWDPVNQWLIELRFCGVSTVMLHHTGKSGLQRGTSGREDNLDISIMLKRPSDYTPEDGCRFICSFTKARVSQDALSLIGDIEFKLIQNESGNYVFVFKNVRRAVKKDVTRMLGEGIKPGAIVETLGVTKGYVSRIKKEGIESGYFLKDGKLSGSGENYVKDDASN
jgi:putative DNA primase/helicase